MYKPLGLSSVSGKTSYHQISWSLGATRLSVNIKALLWNVMGFNTADTTVNISDISDMKQYITASKFRGTLYIARQLSGIALPVWPFCLIAGGNRCHFQPEPPDNIEKSTGDHLTEFNARRSLLLSPSQPYFSGVRISFELSLYAKDHFQSTW